jgi:hypothetical protein
MVPAAVVGAGRYSGRLLAAIDHALAFAEKDRPQTVADWKRELVGDGAAKTTTAAPTERLPPRGPAPPPAVGGVCHGRNGPGGAPRARSRMGTDGLQRPASRAGPRAAAAYRADCRARRG